MSAESRQLLQGIVASWRGNNPDDANDNNRREDNADNANDKVREDARGDQQGRASVRSLARQAQQVIDTLQRLGGEQAGAVAPGSAR